MGTELTYPEYFHVTLMLAIMLPCLSFLISLIVPDRYAWTVSLISPLIMLAAFISASIVCVHAWNNVPYTFSVEWFRVAGRPVEVGILLNNLSALMLGVVSLISFLVHLYSVGYMAGDDGEKKYFGMLGLFTFSMLGIVLADNLLLVFVFWELVGFSSYMLIGHWNEKPAAAAASKKAFIINRIGDAGFLIGLMILWAADGDFRIENLVGPEAPLTATLAGLCIFCGVLGKSAQFPLSTWLPDAMEGPTPVSALIHAATMVAAGVFLMARVFILFTPDALAVITIIGIITALTAALSALAQTDIKKILAYSTISQLGLMVTAIGAGSWEAAMLHLFTHAFFKACLFLCAGSIIHVLHHAQHQSNQHFDVQDIRNLGGLRHRLRFTFIATVISGAALAGIPFFTGFISKEAIFTALYTSGSQGSTLSWVALGLAFIVTFITVLYIVRLVALVFYGEETVTKDLPLHEAPPIMRAPVALLALGSLWFVVSVNPFSSTGYLFHPNVIHVTWLPVASAVWIALALATGFYLTSRGRWISSEMLRRSFYFDEAQNTMVTQPALRMAALMTRIDRKWIDGGLHATAYIHLTVSHLAAWWDRTIVDGLVNGAASIATAIGSLARTLQGGKIQLYVFWSVFTIVIFLIWSLI